MMMILFVVLLLLLSRPLPWLQPAGGTGSFSRTSQEPRFPPDGDVYWSEMRLGEPHCGPISPFSLHPSSLTQCTAMLVCRHAAPMLRAGIVHRHSSSTTGGWASWRSVPHVARVVPLLCVGCWRRSRILHLPYALVRGRCFRILFVFWGAAAGRACHERAAAPLRRHGAERPVSVLFCAVL